ncbi:hypothetical protein SK128_019872, partial [Halocaridina rubra]
GQDVNVEHTADAIRGHNLICQCAVSIRQCLLEYDFDLQDQFCDTNDLKTA